MPRIFVSGVIAQLVGLMNRNFVTGLRDPLRARSSSAMDGLRRGETVVPYESCI